MTVPTAAAYNRYAEWTGTAPSGLLPPGGDAGSLDDEYQDYVRTLQERYNPGRLGRPRRRPGLPAPSPGAPAQRASHTPPA
jgi:hypothetical protein